jgi:folate-binding protein YgfZ
MVSEEEFRLFRLQNDLPLQELDYQQEMLLNVGQDLVSFTKGCFLGQEVLARVHHKSKPPYKLVVRKESELPEDLKSKMTSKTKDPKTGDILGFVFVKNE